MKQIHITRDSNGVHFKEVCIDNTENVFFTNMDPDETHYPDICSNELGPAPSPNSSQCPVPPPPTGQTAVTYGCKLHPLEKGIVNVFPPLAAATTALANGAKGVPIKEQQVVQGGMSPYTISGELFQVTDSNNTVIDSGSGIGPELQLNPDQTNNNGISVTGTPTRSGTYNFTFTVDDAMGGNLQQVQYSMTVV